MASFHGYVELPKADGDRMVANQFGLLNMPLGYLSNNVLQGPAPTWFLSWRHCITIMVGKSW